jgi:hypothetical protein
VSIRADRRDAGALLIKVARNDPQGYALRDARRPRRVSDTRQVTLPAVLADRAGIIADSWVAFTRTRTALRVFSADRVSGPINTVAEVRGPEEGQR